MKEKAWITAATVSLGIMGLLFVLLYFTTGAETLGLGTACFLGGSLLGSWARPTGLRDATRLSRNFVIAALALLLVIIAVVSFA